MAEFLWQVDSWLGGFPAPVPRVPGETRVIALITETAVARQTLGHLSEPTLPPHLMPVRRPPQSHMARAGHRAFDPRAQHAPACEFNPRIDC